MRLSIITETYPPEINGVALSLQRITHALIAQGHEVEIIRPRQSKAAERSGDEETTVPGLPLPGYDGLRFGLPCAGRLKQLWRAKRPDVLYVATEGPLGLSAIRVGRALKIPVTSGFHTNFHEYMRHYKLPLLERAVLAFLRRTHNRTRRTFAPSEDVIQRLEAIGIENIRLLGRGVDRGQFNPTHRDSSLRASWGVGEDGIVALFVSRIAAEKNIPLALRAFARVRERHPEAACVLVGDGPERLALEKKHTDIIFAGMQRGHDLARHYASGDLFIFPSLTETFGNVVTEAMASGLVVCAYNYAAPQKFIADGQSGFLADFGDEVSYLAAIDRALDTHFDWSRLRTAAREATRPLDWAKIVEHFANELAAAIAESKSEASSA